LVLAWLAAATQDTTRLVLMFSGDIMQHDSQLQAAYNVHSGTYAYDTCFYFMRGYYAMADLAIANLELTLGGKPYRGYPQFSAPDELAAALKRARIDVLVTANNHSLDRRRKGLERTIRVLDSLHLYHTGTFRDTVERLNDYPLLLEKTALP
jgi:poly-gamma-glutamate synthesis protein (capsule biosynthesis protein)